MKLKYFLSIALLSTGTVSMAQIEMANLKTLKLTASSATEKINVLKAGDFNGDGKMDLVADGSAGSQSGSIKFNSKPLFILGSSTGLMQASSFPVSHAGASAFIGDVADFNNDGFLDYLVYDFWANGLRLYKGGTGMTWTLHQNMPTGTHGNIGEFKDMDSDGDLDVVSISSGSAAQNTLHFYENNNGVFTKNSYSSNDVDLSSVLSITDINKDGRLDVLSTNTGYYMNCWIQNPDKSFTVSYQRLPYDMYVNNNPHVRWYQDANEDGFDDMVCLKGYEDVTITAAYSETLPPYYGDTADFYSATLHNDWFQPVGSVTGDIDHDGTIDIITTKNLPVPRTEDKVMIIYDPLNLNNHYRMEFLTFPFGKIITDANSFILADLNNDGGADLAMLGKDDTLRYFYNSTPPPTSVNGLSKGERPGFKIYPNPASDFLNIKLNLQAEMQHVKSAAIYNMEGRAVQALTTMHLQSAINIQTLAPGNYYISLYNDKGEYFTEKFVKIK